MVSRLRLVNFAAGLLAFAVAGHASANLPLPATGTSVDFTGFTGAGFDSAPGAGQLDSDFWVVRGVSDGDLAFGATGTTGDYARGESTGGEDTGGVWAFDVGASIALGANPTQDDFTPGAFVLRLRNDTADAVTSLDVAYTLWSNNNGELSDSFEFSWSLDDNTYTDVGALDVSTPGGADNAGWVSVAHTTTISAIDVADGDNIYLRWTFDGPGGGGVHDEFAIDDVEITVPGICGNGVPEAGEECDDGNDDNTDDCVEGCLDASCGDGFVWMGMEECDDGNMDTTDACPDGAAGTCENAECGDGFVWAGMEGCDDGNGVTTDDCPDGPGATCEPAECGDGFVWAGMEECDDGNDEDDDRCGNDCMPNSDTTTTTDGTTTDGMTTGDTATTMGVEGSGPSTTSDTTDGPDDTTTGGPDDTTTTSPTSASASASGSSSATAAATTDDLTSGTDTDSGGVVGEQPPGCGCRSGGGPGWLAAAFVVLGALRRRRRH